MCHVSNHESLVYACNFINIYGNMCIYMYVITRCNSTIAYRHVYRLCHLRESVVILSTDVNESQTAV